jgi:hypothetical protein
LTLTAATGTISGTPTAGGNSNLTATVTDSGNPAQTTSAATSITVASPSGGTTWFVRPDGAPLYYASGGGGNTLHGGCDGQGDIGYVAAGGPTNLTWWANYTYAPGATIVDSGGNVETTAGGGISGSSYWPTWGATTTDGTVHWTRGAAAPTNLHCATGDYRYLYDNTGYAPPMNWVIAGGDTVVVRGCFNVDENGNGATYCRIGGSPPGHPDYWCVGVSGGLQGCSSGPLPAGTAIQHTRILGQCMLAGNCNSGNTTNYANLTQLFGGSGLGTAINLQGTQYVDFEGIEVTRHSQCIGTGLPAFPAHCISGVDDYVAEGIFTDVHTANLTLQDVWVHGMTDTGIRGPFNGNLTANRVNVSYNGQSGWDFDDGASSPTGTTAAFTFTYSQIEWNGCNQEYPITHTYPAISCYGQSNQGYGDGMGTAPGYCFNVTIDNSVFDHNTQDGIDFGHFNTVNRTDGQCLMSITNSLSYANGGAAWKWGPSPTAVIFTDNTGIANCNRMSAPITGAPSTYNANLGDFCRAGDGFTWAFFDHSTLLMANNTFINYAPTAFDVACEDPSGACASGSWTFENNIILGYANLPFTDYGGNGMPALFCGPGCNASTQPWPPMIRSNNIYYGMRGVTCPTGFSGELCLSPLLVNEPTLNGSSFVESELDDFNFHLTSSSPAIGVGAAIPSVRLDYTGVLRANPPSIGAYEK